MISAETSAIIDKFASIVKRANQARSKDIRLDISDASILTAEIANIIARLLVYENSVVKAGENIQVKMDGGGFDK